MDTITAVLTVCVPMQRQRAQPAQQQGQASMAPLQRLGLTSAQQQQVVDMRARLQPGQQGQRSEGEQGNAAGRVEVSGSPRYGAPVTTGHDNQQHAAQSHGPSERGNASSAQVNHSQTV